MSYAMRSMTHTRQRKHAIATNNMTKILLKVDYQDITGKYWQNSYINNKIVSLIDGDIHKTIKNVLVDIDGVELSYNGKPVSNVFIDDRDGNTKKIGYIYRGKSDIYDNGKTNRALFDVWVTIKEVVDYPIEDIKA